MRLVSVACASVLLLVCRHEAAAASDANFTCSDEPGQVVCLPANYDRFTRPQGGRTSSYIRGSGRPLRVTVGIMVEDVVSVGENSATFTAYFNLKWKDERIVVKKRRSSASSVEFLPIRRDLLDHLWTPETFFYGLEEFKQIEVVKPLAGLWVGTDSTVLNSQHVRITVRCSMCLSSFPMDTQECNVMVGSYSKSDKELIYAPDESGEMGIFQSEVDWASRAMDALPFKVKAAALPDKLTFFDYGLLGNFSITGLQLRATRNASPYVVSFYLPAFASVVLSWASFIIPPSRIPSRYSYLAILLLILTATIGAAQVSTPTPNVMTAMQLYFLMCVLFLLAPCIEFTVLLLRQRRGCQRAVNLRRHVKYEAAAGGSANLGSSNGAAADEVGDGCGPDEYFEEEFWKYDRLYMGLFAALFFVFNLVYWLSYAV